MSMTTAPRVLPDDSKIREQYPLFDGLLAYFPAALCEVARWSLVGGAKHTPGEPLHWAREKSTDHENKIVRHLLDVRAEVDDDFVEAVALAWRALALCQTILEERGWPEGANARRKTSTAVQPSAAPPSPIEPPPLWVEPYVTAGREPEHLWADLAPPQAPADPELMNAFQHLVSID
jgi:hypothetical protein